MADTNKISVYAVGDVGMSREDAVSGFKHILPVLHEPDIMFGQLEACLSQNGTPPLTAAGVHRSSANFAESVKMAGFDVMSFASNHCMHFGADGLLDTIRVAKEIGVELAGVGKDIAEARKPVIREVKGTKIAFLAYCSVLPPGYWATENKPGCAPLRANTYYEPEVQNQPGSPAAVVTMALKEDKQAMIADIRKTRELADVVVVSIHWGIPFMEAKIDDYQRELGHAAIDAGADIILGHHAHILRGAEVYKGKVIFYCLGNFLQDASLTKTWPDIPPKWRKIERIYGYKIDREWGKTYPFPTDSRMTIIGKFVVANKKIESVSIKPTYINRDNQPQLLKPSEQTFGEVVKYMEKISRSQKLDVQFKVEGDEAVIVV
jgi:poly-gamma-glutamate synthesis protein (capsule biosynthesis protein)